MGFRFLLFSAAEPNSSFTGYLYMPLGTDNFVRGTLSVH